MSLGRKASDTALMKSSAVASSAEPVSLSPITLKLLPEIKASAVYKGADLIEELNAGNRVDEGGLLQLNHAFDLAKYGAESD